MTYVRISNTNELIHRHQTVQEHSIDELSHITRQYELKTLKFISILPKCCLDAAATAHSPAFSSNQIKLDICFFLLGRDLEPIPLRVNKEIASFQLHSTEDNNEHYYVYECNCEIPHFSDGSIRITYFYCVRDQDTKNSIGMESLLASFYLMRSITIKERTNTNYYDRYNEYSAYTMDTGLNEQLDGLVLFNQTDSGFIQQWTSLTLNVLMRLDILFNKSLAKETHSNFIQRLNNIQSQLVPNSNDYRLLFSRMIVARFESEVKKMASTDYLEDWQYVSLMSMFYVLNKFQINLRPEESLRFFNIIFELHRPRLLAYFKLLKDYFSDLKKDICKYIQEYLKKIVSLGPFHSGLNALFVLSFIMAKPKQSPYLLDYSMSFSDIVVKDLIKQLDYYYDFFEQSVYAGALFISYVPFKSENVFNIYFNGNNRTGYFPLQAYLAYFDIYVQRVNDRSMPAYQYLDEPTKNCFQLIIRHINEKYSSLPYETQLKMISILNSLLGNLVDKCTKEYDLFANVLDLNLSIIFSNNSRILSEQSQRNSANTVHRSLSTNNEMIASREDIHSLYKNLIDHVRNLFRKECSDSLLINFGLEPRPVYHLPARIISNTGTGSASSHHHRLHQSEDPADFSMLEDAYVGTDNEAHIYKTLLEIKMNQEHPNLAPNRHHHHHSELSIETFYDDIFRIFKERCDKRLDIRFGELIKFRSQFDFRRFQRFVDKFSSTFDSLIQERIQNKPLINELNELCSTLFDTRKVVLRAYVKKLLADKWPKAGDDNLLKFVLTWPLFQTVYENQIHFSSLSSTNSSNPLTIQTENTYNEANQLLSFAWNEKFIQTFRYIIGVLNSLAAGNAFISDIVLLNSNADKSARKLVKFLGENLTYLKSSLQFTNFDQLISVRMKEVNEFDRYTNNMKLFIQFSANFEQIKMNKYIECINELPNNKGRLGELSHYCRCAPVSQMNSLPSNYFPNITYFPEINTVVMETIDKIVSMDRAKCVMFDFYFRETLIALSSQQQEIHSVIGSLWEITLRKWKSLADEIDSQKIKLIRLDHILSSHFQMNFDQMLSEHRYLLNYFNKITADSRIYQIQLWYKFRASYDAAFAIKKIKDLLQLTNKFTELNDLLQITSEHYQEWKLEKMDQEIAETVKCLEIMNDRNKLNCLKAFSESLELVNWLRLKIKGLAQLKTLVDSLFMSAALDKSPQATNRTVLAKTLKDAGSAYAALIYELKPDHDFKKFMSLCEQVCEFLVNDPKIAEKLLAVRDKWQLFDEIVQQTETAERNSLKTAKYLNKNGLYLITAKTGDENSIDELIQLHVVDSSVASSLLTSHYSYTDLKELQNILLLIAPRPSNDGTSDEDDVELKYFIQMLDRVSHLALRYLKLIEYGCVYFDEFRIEISCQNGSTKVNHLVNSVDSSMDCTEHLIIYFDQVLSMWSAYVTSLRDSYDCVNYYTIKQLKFITKCFKKNKTNELTVTAGDLPMIRSILFNLDTDLSLDKLHKALKQSQNKRNDSEIKHLESQMSLNSKLKDSRFASQLNLQWIQFINGHDTTSLSLKDLANLFDYIKTAARPNNDVIKRKKPDYLTNEGEPNLITCPAKIQIPIVLSIYGLSMEQTMPSNDELIYCDQRTTYEDLEIFLRRAFRSHGERIYTLLNVQDLRYEASSQLESFLISPHQIQKTNSFVLVLICCSNTNSLISSLLSRNQVKPIFLPNSVLEEYLDTRLQTPNRMFTLNNENTNKKAYSVRALLSQRSGNGKSMYVKHLVNRLKATNQIKFDYKVIRIKSACLDMNAEIDKLISNGKKAYFSRMPTVYHIDLAHEVFRNVDQYLFSLIVCGYLKHSVSGLVWRRNLRDDLFLIEMSPPYNVTQTAHQNRLWSIHSLLNYLPRIEFRTPRSYLYDLINRSQFERQHSQQYESSDSSGNLEDNLFSFVYTEIRFQRCVYYLRLVMRISQREAEDHNQLNGNIINYAQGGFNANELFAENYLADRNRYTQIECLETLNECTKLNDPNWFELNNFVNFLDQQLAIFENSAIIKQVPCLKSLVVQLLVIMSNDFGLPSLNINFNLVEVREQSPGAVAAYQRSVSYRSQLSAGAFEVSDDLNSINISLYDLQINENRRWEKMIHPYIIFNADGESIVFLGTCMDRSTHKFINPQTNEFLQDKDQNIPRISHEAFLELINQRTGIFENFDKMVREKKVDALSKVMGLDIRSLMAVAINESLNEFQSYELTLDNCLKMMAIYLRFKANNPVVIMGETGCGKTSLVRYFGFLNLRSRQEQRQNLLHMKIHGGTTAQQIEAKLIEAENLSKQNYELFVRQGISVQSPITAILFLDEANTTEAIGLIKEIMCDLTCNGRPIIFDYGLKIVAAVNPYKKHSDEMIKKLEQAGLGFFVSSSATTERIGQIPMRQLVYRVQALPTSLLPIVWDFGSLNKEIEQIYINQMLNTAAERGQLGENLVNYCVGTEQEIEFLVRLIVESQLFMRSKKDECSFVSIRDVERVIKVTEWFLAKQEIIFSRMNKRKISTHPGDAYQTNLKPLHRAFILALTVCYHSCMYKNETRSEYRKKLQDLIKLSNPNPANTDWIQTEILKCQNIFMDEIDLQQMTNIARNSALLENVFMMIICIELRIPLFIVGKPGSSKSLAKSIVSRAMIGRNSKSPLFRDLKETYFVNFQCSPLTTSEMIVKAFREAAEFQKSNMSHSVSVVNLDEIGLAEGSEAMPLKTLHSLLEEGACSDNETGAHFKVGVIGISNWALDPAKMNRGLFVSRGDASIEDLISSAEGICNYDVEVYDCIKPHVRQIAEAYLELCNQASQKLEREFFGLRDYYSLIKMLYWFARKDRQLKWSRLEQAVKRNFNGINIDILGPFRDRLHHKLFTDSSLGSDQPLYSSDLIKSALLSEHMDTTSRYLLFLTENSSAIDIIQTYLTSVVGLAGSRLAVIFGSSFRSDLQYSEVCRNISLIKHCMESGKTVILLNSYNLYESLYDALNQYYYEMHSQRYVDLGLGTHRIKCSVHESFRLIVIAEQAAVYDTKRFPIPLINRLEKHFLNAATMLNEHQTELRDELNVWLATYLQANHETKTHLKMQLNELFIGLHDDTTSALVLHLTSSRPEFSQNNKEEDVKLLNEAKRLLIQCATPDSIIRFCGNQKIRPEQRDSLWQEYFVIQKHLSLAELIRFHLSMNKPASNLIQLSTHSKSTLSSLDKKRFGVDEICLLKSFDTQIQFEKKIDEFLSRSATTPVCLLIQADLNEKYSADLIACARYTIVEKFKAKKSSNAFIFFLINLPKENAKQFIGFQLGNWSCYHLDEIEAESDEIPAFAYLKEKSLTDLLKEKTNMRPSALLKRLTHTACSLIKDTNLERTIKRIDLFTRLCDESKQFVDAILARLIGLLQTREYDYSGGLAKKWLIREAANLKTIKEYATIRRSCQHYFESRLSPLLGFLLAYLDQYSNLDIFFNSFNRSDTRAAAEWKAELWIDLLNNADICRLDYNEMRITMKEGDEEEMREFKCQSDWLIKSFHDVLDENRCLKPLLPFFWILVGQLNKLYENFVESNKKMNRENMASSDETSIEILKSYETTISQFFEETKLYTLLNQIVKRHHNDSKFTQSVIDAYINDFILINCAINSNKDLLLIRQLIWQLLSSLNVDSVYKSNLKFALPMVHYVFSGVEKQITFYLNYSKFEPNINESSLFNRVDSDSGNERVMEIHLDAALEAIRLFKLKKTEYFFDSFSQKKAQLNLTQLTSLVQLVSQTLSFPHCHKFEMSKQYSDKITQIKQQYESLSLLLLFLDTMCLSDWNASRDLLLRLNELKNKLSLEYFNLNVNFKTKATNQKLQMFIVNAYNSLKGFTKSNDEIQDNLNIFYFNTVEYLVFNDRNEPPDDETIDLILNSITEKELRSNNEQQQPFRIEPTYRALLIQIVFKNYNEKVIEHLDKWFKQGTITGQNQLFESSNELALLFQDCVHDQYIHNLTAKQQTLCDQITLANSVCAELLVASNQRTNLIQIFKSRKMYHATYDVACLVVLAKLKFCLGTMSRACYSKDVFDAYKHQKEFKEFNTNLKNLITITFGQGEEAHMKGQTDTFINYLIKDMIRKYGSSSIKYVLAESDLSWMTPPSIIGNQEFVTDKYVLCPYSIYIDDKSENKYIAYKKAIHECFEEKNLRPILTLIEHTKLTGHQSEEHLAYLGISLYHKVTLLYKSIEDSTNQIVEYFEALEPKHLFKPLLRNSFTHNLKVNKENWRHIDLSVLLIQIKFCLLYSSRENDLLMPLKELLIDPASAEHKYLPTMPQDSVYDVKTVLADTAMYSCPNGHKYVIADCHRPWVLGKCNECGSEIGGTNHKSAEGNIKIDEIVDKTIKGYSLPKANDLKNLPLTERLLNAFEFQIERFFLHACLYLACGDEDEQKSSVLKIMKLAQPSDVKQFFWEHMQKDLKITCDILNLTLDELIIVLHLITFGFLRPESSLRGAALVNTRGSFDTKAERQFWEDSFNRTYLATYLVNSRKYINEANNEIQSRNQGDNDSQQSKIYFMAYELLKEPNYKDVYLYEHEKFWKFRALVTFDSMSVDLINTPDLREQFKILKKFNELKSKLKLVFNLPRIVELVNFLKKTLFKSIFKYTAQNKSIGQFFSEINLPKEWTMEKVKSSVGSFQTVWSYAKQNLKEYVRNNLSNSLIIFNTDYEFNLNSKLSYFLPTLSGDGLFSYSLINFLSTNHNEIISFYHEIKRIDHSLMTADSVLSVDMFENADLIIKFDENNDLFRLVQANFMYDSKNLKCVYKFRNIENQLINRYLRAKPKIDIQNMKLFEYSDEINDLSIFKQIEQKTLLDLATQIDLIDEFNKINEISEALNTLKLVINYASTLSADSAETISSFIKKIYSNDPALFKQSEQILKTKIIEKCQLKHLKHVWILLMMKRCILYTINNQDPFDYLNESFKMPAHREVEFNLGLLESNSLWVSVLVVLYQIITFDLSLLHGDDIDRKKGILIRDIMECLNDYQDFLIPANLNKLPRSFPDQQPDAVSNEHNSQDDVEMQEPFKLENIYALWKILCKKIK